MKTFLKENIDEISTPAYYFDFEEFKNRAMLVKDALGMIPLTYSVKANPFLLAELPEAIDRVEACSPGELAVCIRNGISSERIIYSGVNKEIEDVEDALGYRVGIVSIESIKQLECVQYIADKKGIKQKIFIRLTSGNQFGMAENELLKILSEIDNYSNIIFCGIHYYSGTQKSIKQLNEELDYLSDFFYTVKQQTGYTPEILEYGPGLRVDYFGNVGRNSEMDYFRSAVALITDFSSKYHIGIEVGRFLAASCGIYATRIKDIKVNNGINYAICDGGIHQIKYYGQNHAMQIPRLEVLKCEDNKDFYCVCGSLCTVADVLIRKVELPILELNDVLLFGKCGAYSVTEGMALFLSRDFPEVYLFTKKRELLKSRERISTYEFNTI